MATWIQLGNIFPSTSQSKWPSRMNHPVDGIDPEGFPAHMCPTRVYVCVRIRNMYAHDVLFARGASPSGPPSIIERKRVSIFIETVGCHVKLHRRAFPSHSHVYTRRHWRHACRGVEYRIRHVRDEQTPRLSTCLRNCRGRSLVCRSRFRFAKSRNADNFSHERPCYIDRKVTHLKTDNFSVG